MPAVFICGINGGIGRGVAAVFNDQGWQVAGADLEVSGLDDAGWRTFAGDVRSENDVAAWFAALTNDEVDLTCLVNVAGINYKSPIDDCDLDAWSRLIDVNVLGMVRTIKHAAPLLRSASNSSIVNMSSISARIGSHGYAAYCTSKGAIDSLTRSLALELAPSIRVNALAPGWVDTEFSTAGLSHFEDADAARQRVYDMHALGRIATVHEVGDAVFWLASTQASFMTGSVVDLDGGYLIKN